MWLATYEAENYRIQSQDNLYEISNLDGEAIAKFELQSTGYIFWVDSQQQYISQQLHLINQPITRTFLLLDIAILHPDLYHNIIFIQTCKTDEQLELAAIR